MTTSNPKRLTEIPLHSFGRPFDDHFSLCLTNEQLVIEPSFSFCQGSLNGNIGHFRRLGLVAKDLAFDILDDSRFNALATNFNNHEVILINSGVPVCLVAIFYKLLSFRTLFPWVGAPEVEREEVLALPGLPDSFENSDAAFLRMVASEVDRAKVIQALLQNRDEKARADYGPRRLARTVRCPVAVRDVVPLDKERRTFVGILLKWSLSFIMYHEIAHVFHGHVDFLAQQSSTSHYQEIGPMLEAAVRQEQEHQADTFATIVTFLPLIEHKDTIYPEIFAGDQDRFLYTWAFVVAVVFTVLSLSEPPPRDDDLRSHPQPFHRLAKALVSALGRAHLAGLPCRPEHINLALTAWEDIDKHLQALLPGQYEAVFRAGRVTEIYLPMEETSGQFKHAEKWRQFDRLTPVMRQAERFQIIYQP
jgi:hypothetical protein